MEPRRLELRVANDLAAIARQAPAVTAFLRECGVEERRRHLTELAVEEVLSNVVRHGFEAGDDGRIELSIEVADDAVELSFRDDGRAFDPIAAPAVDVSAPLEQRRVGGLGVMLLKRFARRLAYERRDRHNLLRVTI